MFKTPQFLTLYNVSYGARVLVGPLEKNEATGLVREGLAREACRVIPLVFIYIKVENKSIEGSIYLFRICRNIPSCLTALS